MMKKLGVIIYCYNIQDQINKENLCRSIRDMIGLEICLVNNHSNDKTYHQLLEIQELCTDVTVINLNKKKSEQAAIRAGARFMFNKFKFPFLICLTAITEVPLHQLLEQLDQQKQAFVNDCENDTITPIIRFSREQNVFRISLNELLASKADDHYSLTS